MMIKRSDGTCEWYLHGKLHREDGPAIECINGTTIWYYKGNLHREDGPAINYINGAKEWYLHGKKVSPKDLPCDYEYLKLKYLL